MKNLGKRLLGIPVALMCLVMLFSVPTAAAEGSMGYAGGISVVDRMNKDAYLYREVVFVTGTPIVLDGTLTIKKSVKADSETATYTYRLANETRDITLTRVQIYDTAIDKKANGQLTKSTRLNRVPTEVLRIGGVTYTLSNEFFTRSILTDPRPAIDYHAGEFTSRKIYRVGNGAGVPTVTVDTSGRIYAYDQHWSNTQTQLLNVQVTHSGMNGDQWGGSATVTLSSSAHQRMLYRENQPTQISFDGGYVRTTWNESTLEYLSTFPEFDKEGNATERMVTENKRLAMDTEPVSERLMVPNIQHLKGHWHEEPIHILFGLEVIPGTGDKYNPQKYLTRTEYVAQAVRVLKAVPQDPNARVTAVPLARRTTTAVQMPFVDVKEGDPHLDDILDASKREIVIGRGHSYFRPEAYITRAEAVTIIVRALGLENLAAWPVTVAPFADNDRIPEFARNAAAVAYQMGVVGPDDNGRFRPNDMITAGETAVLLHRLINYMGDDLVTDYRERINNW